MEINVEKLAEILKKDNAGVSFGVFEIEKQPSIGVLFVRIEHVPEVQKFAEQLINWEAQKTKVNP